MAKRYTVIDSKSGRSSKYIKEDKVRKRYHFPGGFAFVGLVYISKLARIKMPMDAFRLALLFMENAEYAGVSIKPHGFYAEVLGVSRPRISHLVTILEEQSILRRIGGRAVLVNPLFCHRGTPEEQLESIKRWDALALAESNVMMIDFPASQSA